MHGRRGNLRAWMDGVLTLPLVLPPTVVGFCLLLAFGRRSPLGLALEHIGVMVVFSWPATVIAATVVAFPLMYRTALAGFEQVNPTLLDAARTLGVSEWTVFRRILLPLAAPAVVAGTVLAFARALGEFGATLMLAGNIPGRTQTIPIAIFSAVEDGNMALASFWVSLIVVISIAMIRLLNLSGSVIKKQRNKGVLSAPHSLEAEIRPAPKSNQLDFAALLQVNLCKELDGFNLRVNLQTGKGALGLLGASGAGKSMTLRMIAGIAHPDSGRIILNNRVLFDSDERLNTPAAKRKIGVVFQDYALFPHLTVAENVGFGLMKMPENASRLRVDRLLNLLHISELASRFPRELSGGQRQRVAVARCLAIEPDALLFDEPFAALDPHLRRQTEEQLRETLSDYRGAVIFVTHDMQEAFRFCSDLAVLDEGCVIASGPRNELFDQPRTVATAQLTGCKNIVSARPSKPDAIWVQSWGCELVSSFPVPDSLTHIGVRSHQILLQQSPERENTFPCWLMEMSEAPHEVTLYLHLHTEPQNGDSAQLQADIPKEAWHALRIQAQPWRITFDPARLLLLQG